MKFVKFIIFLSIVFSSAQTTSAHYGTSGYGCNLGNVVYTQKIGTTKFYGTDYDVYKSDGMSYPIDWNNSSTPNQINSNNIQNQGEDCWVNSYVNPKNNNTGATYGTLVYYTVNPIQTNLPLDDYIWVFIVIVGGLGAYSISRKQISPPGCKHYY